MSVISTSGLGRFYGPVVGLSDLTVDVPSGITGLLGPNGAGKSTLLKLVVGELKPSRGELSVLGEVPFANRALYRRLGFAPQQDALYGHLSGLAFVQLAMRLGGYPKAEARARALRALERVDMTDAMHRRCAGYSKGMRQRTKLAQAIAHDPELLVLDEPLTGLDPMGRRQMLSLFRELGQQGTSILVSSHVLHEVEALTDEVLLVHRGRMLARGSVGEIRQLLDRHPRRLKIKASDPRRLAGLLVQRAEVQSLEIEAGRLSLRTEDLPTLLQALTPIAAEAGVGMSSIESPDAGLEAVFDYLVG